MTPKRIVSLLLPLRIKSDSISIFLQKRSADMEQLPNYFGFWGGGCEGDYGKWFTVAEALDRNDIIFEDKVVLQDLERMFLQQPVR